MIDNVPVTVLVGGTTHTVDPKVFGKPEDGDRRSFGWYLSGKIRATLDVNGTPIETVTQAGLQFVIVNSKDAPRA